MPYLHWETDRQRSKFDETMRNITELHNKMEETRVYGPSQVQSNGNAKGEPVRPKSGLAHQESDFRVINTATEVFDAAMKHQVDHYPESKFSKTSVAKQLTSKGILAPKTPVGQIFHRAALLSEAMDNYQEQELLKTYLHHDPPFHPRRTLDQSYYWTLKTTKHRDRDQVVYRGTAPKKKFMHSGLHPKVDGKPCRQCCSDIRKVPRVIMVDQLWLWILDGSECNPCQPHDWRPTPESSTSGHIYVGSDSFDTDTYLHLRYHH